MHRSERLATCENAENIKNRLVMRQIIINDTHKDEQRRRAEMSLPTDATVMRRVAPYVVPLLMPHWVSVWYWRYHALLGARVAYKWLKRYYDAYGIPFIAPAAPHFTFDTSHHAFSQPRDREVRQPTLDEED